jgi:hypothetical protein
MPKPITFSRVDEKPPKNAPDISYFFIPVALPEAAFIF